jgi:FkbM family methyltransferase
MQRLRGGVHDPEFLRLGLRREGSPLIFDVGANVGQAATTFFKLSPSARVVSFEPYSGSLRRLLALRPGSANHVVVPVACAAVSGEVLSIRVPFVGKLPFTQLATILDPDPEFVSDFLSQAGFGNIVAADVWYKEQPAVTLALDDLDLAPDVIKIDVEGAELGVLRGAKRLLTEGRPILIVETDKSTDAHGFLADFGYEAQQGTVNTIFRPI